MFEKIVLRKSEDGQLSTLGDLAEALLFYQRVHLILDRSTVANFVRLMGMEQFLKLLERENVSAVYCREMVVTISQQIGALTHHNFSGMEVLSKAENKTKTYSNLDSIHDILNDLNKYSSRTARKLAERFLEKVPVKSLVGKDFTHGGPGLMEQALADLYDQSYITEAISRALQHTQGFAGFDAPLSLEVLPTQSGFTVFSNLDLTKTNKSRAQRQPALEGVTEAHLLSEVLTARADVMLASHYGSDFKTSNSGSSIINLRYRELMRGAGIHEEELNKFQEVIVNQGRSLKEAIDSGERPFEDFLRLLDKANLFKRWSAGVHPDGSMVAEYLEENSRQGWVASLPGKGLRFVIGGVMDVVLPGSGIAYGLADSFILEKIAGGWRPNHFVERRLKPFIG